MLAEDGLTKAAHVPLTLEPKLKGKLHWESPTRLVFTPKEPLEVGEGMVISIAAARAFDPGILPLEDWSQILTVAERKIAGKVVSWPKIRGRPRLVTSLTVGNQFGPSGLLLVFDQSVEPRRVARGITLADSSGKAVAFRARRADTVAPLFNDPLDLSYVVRLSPVRLPDNGEELELTVPSWETGSQGLDKTTETLTFVVNRDFSLSSHGFEETGTDDRVPLSAVYTIEANNPVFLPNIRSSISIQPEPESRSVDVLGNQIRIQLGLLPGTRYRMAVEDIQDYLGNKALAHRTAFRTKDLPSRLMAPMVPVAVELASPRLPVQLVNARSLSAKVYRVPSLESYLGLFPVGESANCEGSPAGRPIHVRSSGKLNEQVTAEISLQGYRGLLCVELAAEGRGSEAAPNSVRALVQVSDLAATVKASEGGWLVWATRVSDATPVRSAKVEILDSSGAQVASSVTNSNGIARLDVPRQDTEDNDAPLFVSIRTQKDSAVTLVDKETLSSAWQFGLPAATKRAMSLSAALFTDRGVYRPGDTVHLKAIVRGRGDVQMSVSDPRGQSLFDKPCALDALGGTEADLTLGEKAAVGEYTVRLTRNGETTTRHFRTEEYRIPTFEVKVAADGNWANGKQARANVQAKYLHGAALSGRSLKWNVLREPVPFQPSKYSGFAFTSEPRPRAGQVDGAEAKLDGNGSFDPAFQPVLDATTGPMRYVIEASVTDLDRQVYSGRISKVLHPGDLYVGLRPPESAVLGVGTIEVPVVAVNASGDARPGVKIDVDLERLDFHNSARLSRGTVSVSSEAVPKDLTHCTVVSAATPVLCRIALNEAGRYRIRGYAAEGGQRVGTQFEVTVAGGNAVAWPRFAQDRITVVADRTQYRVGDVAKLIVQTPFEHAKGLLTVERNGVISHSLFEIAGNTPALEVPVTEEMIPNVFVSVVLLRGRQHDLKDATGFETGAPTFRMGYAELEVEPAGKRLAVDVTPSVRIAEPGQTMDLALRVRNAHGAPVAGKVVIAVVDEAVLGLTGFATPDPVSEQFARNSLGVRTAESRLDLLYSRRGRQEVLFPGGDGEDGNLHLELLPGELRTLFNSTAYWNPRVDLAADGTAQVSVKLPDNLTTFRIMAVAYSAGGRSGSSQAKVQVRKPLMVQPVLPRFAYPGDRFLVEALVVNGAQTDGVVRIGIAELEGLTPREPLKVKSLTVNSGGSAKVSFPVEVTGRGQARVRFSAEMGTARDQVESKLPILDAGAKRVFVASRQAKGREALTLDLPANRLPGSTQLEVMVSTTPLSELKDAVEHLLGYPNGCIEQTTSTAYPLVVLKDLLPDMGVTVDEADLKKFSEAGVKRLLSFQTSSGGLSYWPGSDSPHVFGTTFGLTALIEAKTRGYDVPDEALRRAADYLEASLKKGEIRQEMPHAGMPDGDTRALVCLTLHRLGRSQPSYVATLWRERAKLSPFGIAMLAATVSEGGGDRSLLDPMLAEVRKSAVENGNEAWFDGERDHGWSMGSPLRTHAAALLAFAGAETQTDATPKLLAGLLKRKGDYGIWGNTQEDVYGIMGVARLARGSGSGQKGPVAALNIGGSQVSVSSMEKVTGSVRRYVAPADKVGVAEGAAGKASITLDSSDTRVVFLTARLKYEVPLVGSEREARSAGFTITRKTETLDGKPIGGSIPLGSVVKVRVLVQSGEKRNYVAIDDKLPAGLEPLNASLATTERISLGEANAEVLAGQKWLSFQETRDSRVAFFADELPAGLFEYAYLARATMPGHFLRPAASVEAMYEPEVSGHSAIEEIDIVPMKASPQ